MKPAPGFTLSSAEAPHCISLKRTLTVCQFFILLCVIQIEAKNLGPFLVLTYAILYVTSASAISASDASVISTLTLAIRLPARFTRARAIKSEFTAKPV